jgi:peptide methionine sulfoxide reductase MsrB
MGPVIAGGITVARNIEGRSEVFAIGVDGRLSHSWQTDADARIEWARWEHRGPELTADPAVGTNADGHLELFAAGPERRLGHVWRLGPRGQSGWSAWAPLGPEISGRPALALNTNGHLELFARAADGRLGHVWQTQYNGAAGWGTWESFGVEITSDPAAFINVDGHVEVFARDAEGRLGHMWQQSPRSAGWSEWSELVPEISGTPSVCPSLRGQLEVFARGPDGRLGHVWQLVANARTGWSDWEPVGPVIAGDPVAARGADGRLEVFAVTPEGVLGHAWLLDADGLSGWSEWEELDVADPSVRLAVTLLEDRGAISAPRAAVPARGQPFSLRADYCVIGAGPAGLTICDRLARAGASVVLVESGGTELDPVAHSLSRGVAVGPIVKDDWNYLHDGRRRQVGGAATGWGRGWCMPFRDLDFAPRKWIEHSGWPITREELEPYALRAAETFEFEPFGEPRSEAGLERLLYRYPANPQRFPAIFAELENVREFHAELGMTAVQLDIRGERIHAVHCRSIDGDELRVAADTVLLAAGAVENARQLLLHEPDLPLLSPLTGRCFMEHPHVVAGIMHVPDPEPLLACMRNPELNREDRELEVLALDVARQETERIGSASVQLRPVGRPGGGPTDCSLYVRIEQVPNYDSRVTLGRAVDYYGRARPYLEWNTLEQDWRTVVATAVDVGTVLERRFGGLIRLRVRSDAPWPGRAAGPGASPDATWGYHQMGTTRMSESADSGVVDSDCRVHGMDNLYVAGASVFPTGSCANPTFMIVALAHRLAEHLLTRRGVA